MFLRGTTKVLLSLSQVDGGYFVSPLRLHHSAPVPWLAHCIDWHCSASMVFHEARPPCSAVPLLVSQGGRVTGQQCCCALPLLQGCFLPGGALPVQLKDTNALVTKINNLRTVGGYDVVVFTQDYHPANHISFAAVHHKQPAEMVQLQYTADALICDMEHLYPEASFPCSNNSSNIALQSSRRSPLGGGAGETAMHTVQQMLWPEHCVQNNEQVALHPALLIRPHDILVRKGWKAHLDAYSAFLDNGEVESTGLADLLHQRGITSVTVVGVALDYCVLWSALDAVKLGFNTSVVLEATAPVSAGGGAEAERRLRDAGVQLQQYVWDVAES